MKIVNWAPEVITDEIEEEMMNRLENAGHIIANRASQKVPVLTGTLKSTIRVVRLHGDPKLNVRVYAGSRVEHGSMKKGAERGAFYAHMVEYGTVNMPAKPFLRPALSSSRKDIMNTMENG